MSTGFVAIRNTRLDDGLENLRVGRQQIASRLTRLLGDASADRHDVRIPAVAVVAVPDLHVPVGEGKRMIEVHRLALRLLLHIVNQRQLIAGILIQHRVGIAHAHHTAADQHHSLLLFAHDNRPF